MKLQKGLLAGLTQTPTLQILMAMDSRMAGKPDTPVLGPLLRRV